MGHMAIRVAIIDDDATLRDGLRTVLSAVEGLSCCGAFPSVEEALPALRSTGADVLLLDIELPGVPGDQAVVALRTACPAMRILMLTVYSDRDKLFNSICLGAHGYLLKSTPPSRLLEAIHAARDGGSPFSPEMARHMVDLFQKKVRPQSSAALTAQEQRLLALLADGHSYQSAADQLHVSVNTVRNYVRSIYDKLHVHTKSEAVGKAMRQGLIG